MKFYMLCFFLFQGLTVLAKTPQIEDVRLMFHQAGSSQKVCEELIELLKPYDELNNPLLLGYRAGATMLTAKHLFNPFSKLSYFKDGKQMLERAIQANQKNVELRFLRYTVQTNVPSFLNYSSSKEKDRIFLLESLPDISDSRLKSIIISYLKTNKAV